MKRPDQQLIDECDESVVKYIEQMEQTLNTFKSMEVIAIEHANSIIKDGLLTMFDREIQEADKQVTHHLVLGTISSCRHWVEEFMNGLITGEAK